MMLFIIMILKLVMSQLLSSGVLNASQLDLRICI